MNRRYGERSKVWQSIKLDFLPMRLLSSKDIKQVDLWNRAVKYLFLFFPPKIRDFQPHETSSRTSVSLPPHALSSLAVVLLLLSRCVDRLCSIRSAVQLGTGKGSPRERSEGHSSFVAAANGLLRLLGRSSPRG